MGNAATTQLDDAALAGFMARLTDGGYLGEVATGLAPRLVAATDNSIYQVRPAMVLHPREGADLNRIVRAAGSPKAPIPLAVRGGGTGTNGQSLTPGVVVDVSRHLNRIVSVDVEARVAVVEPGVVLDQLNAALKPHGLFFPPSVSTASRATIGGMVATDASGKGSRIYGKTSAWIDALDLVLSDGSDWRAEAMERETAGTIEGEAVASWSHRIVLDVVTAKAALIAQVFPNINRGLTGYNLRDVIRPDGRFDLTALLAGSEGTLALTKAVTLRLAVRPRHRALVVARYDALDSALRDVQRLIASEPSAVEVLDDKVLAVAAKDVIWNGIEAVLGGPAARPVKGLSFIEFIGDDPALIAQSMAEATRILATSPHPALDWREVRDEATVAKLWSLREKSVGLLGRMGGKRQGTAFVEDTAVPPERLADYVAEFRAILDKRGLAYGMFGHADVGCLHVRPALDMTDPSDAGLIRGISDEVATLTKRYGGLLWGEHGRGYRGEYSPLFFGTELYGDLCRIKAAFDPLNILNPGKLASPDPATPLDRIDAVPIRGAVDRTIDAGRAAAFDRATACNGNAACHGWDVAEPMCPSFKATRDRVQSPKGRAVVLREWARLASARDRGEDVAAPLARLEGEVKATLDTCLACKACATQCPVRVDIPTMRSRFLAEYYKTRGRPLRHHAMAGLEAMLPVARRFPGVANRLLARPWLRRRLETSLGVVDLPAIVPMRSRAKPTRALRAEERVVLLRDSFTSTFDGAVPETAVRLLERLGFTVTLSPVWANGKAEHVLGMQRRFARKARRAQALRRRLAGTGARLVSLDAATGLLFDDEYQEAAPVAAPSPVIPIERLLLDAIASGRIPPRIVHGPEYRLHLHCTERTARPDAAEQWRKVLGHFGLNATVAAVGCCGMAGMFGHEAEHAALSARIFDLSWRESASVAPPEAMLATGFSCRCQTKRLAGHRPRHPVEVILDRLESTEA